MADLSMSVIVPVFDEEAYIAQCLDALLRQRRPVDEIIVVDNNSSDGTRGIVEEYARRHSVVRLVDEPRPGVVHARNRGFDAAVGAVLGRVDGDSRVREDWSDAVLSYLEREDTQDVAGVTGFALPYDSPYRDLKRRFLERRIARGEMGGERPIAGFHGANMAIRDYAWKSVRDRTSRDTNIHEDVDLGACLVESGQRIAHLDTMWVDVSPRRAYSSPRAYVRYLRSAIETGRIHGRDSKLFRTLVWAHLGAHVVLWAAYGPYDPRRGRFTLRSLVSGRESRALPVTASNDTRR